MSRIFSVIVVLVFAVFAVGVVWGEQESNPKKRLVGYALFYYSDDRTDLPVLKYRSSRGHHGGWISDSDIGEIFIWMDGTIAWNVAPKEKRYDSRWYQTTIPVEKVEAAVREITESFAKYPADNRHRRTSMILGIDASYSPSIAVLSSQHYESFCVDNYLWEFYKKNRELLQTGDDETRVETIAKIKNFAWKQNDLVEHYRWRFPDAGFSEKRNPVYREEEILKCVEFLNADMEHGLLMEKKILELLPSVEGLEAKKIKTQKRDFFVECERKDGKDEFFYPPMSESEKKKIFGR